MRHMLCANTNPDLVVMETKILEAHSVDLAETRSHRATSNETMKPDSKIWVKQLENDLQSNWAMD